MSVKFEVNFESLEETLNLDLLMIEGFNALLVRNTCKLICPQNYLTSPPSLISNHDNQKFNMFLK